MFDIKNKKLVMSSLKGKIIFITGASSGIGKASAQKFAAEGANLILTARRLNRISILAASLCKKYKVKVLPIRLDIRIQKNVKETIKNLPSKWKKIDLLLNNAGLARGFEKIYDGEISDWEEMIDTNVKGLLYITREILPSMVKRKKGHIINIGSIAGHEVYPKGNVYCATKFAVKALSQSIRLDVLDKNIKVSSIDPGMVYTEFSEVRFRRDKKRAEKVYENLKPLTAEDIAEAIIFCATRPSHVNINEIILTSINQASSTQIFRES
jgi:3-hydroxy acid dehydrogenase / malonic semialdehyde reductase